MKPLTLITAAAAIQTGVLALPGSAQALTETERLEELDQKVRILERKLELQQEEADKKAKESPSVKVGDMGLSFDTKDGNYQFRINALFQGDGRFFIDDNDTAGIEDTFLLRRVRPTLQGQLGRLFAFRITPEFAGDSATLVDAYADLKFSPAATLRIGRVKGPVGLERLQSGGAIAFAERAFPTELAPNRDLGVQLQGELLDRTLHYTVGLYNGTPDGRDAVSSDPDDEHEIAARLFYQPFANQPDSALQGLGFGIGASQGRKEGAGNNFLPRYRSPGQETIFSYRSSGANLVSADGDHTRISPQAYYYRNALGLLAEYISSEQEVSNAAQSGELEHKAWQLTASWVLTGEDASYRGVARPANDFDWSKGHWGAFELAARIGELDIDDAAFDGGAGSFADPNTQVSEAKAYGLGLNWYLSSNLKTVFNYTQTDFDGGAAGGGDRDDEKVFITRVQYQF